MDAHDPVLNRKLGRGRIPQDIASKFDGQEEPKLDTPVPRKTLVGEYESMYEWMKMELRTIENEARMQVEMERMNADRYRRLWSRHRWFLWIATAGNLAGAIFNLLV